MEKKIKSLIFSKRTYLLMFFLNLYNATFSQPNIETRSSERFTLGKMIVGSNFIFEGSVSKIDYFIDKDSLIYTSATIRVSKIFKGESADSFIEIIYKGGYFEGITIPYQIYSQGFNMSKGDDGIFFVNLNKSIDRLSKSLQSYNLFSFINYHHDKSMTHNFATFKRKTYDDIEKDLYEPIEAATGQKYVEVHPNNCKPAQQKK